MNVIGVGIDLVAVPRVARLIERHGTRALERVLTPGEREYCLGKVHPAQSVAARIAAKEAAFKALALDQEALRIGWTELEVVRDRDGRPQLVLHGRAEQAARRLGVCRSAVSLTHEREHAAAMVVLLG
jgi:holo-[acyl-carrier protein] synthase